MTLIHLHDKGLTPFQQLLGYNEGIQLHWQQLGEVLEKDGHLSASLKEEVRKTLAQKMAVSIVRQKANQIHNTMMRKQPYVQVLQKHS